MASAAAVERTRWGLIGVVLAAAAGAALVLGVIGGLWGRTAAGNTALVVPFGGGPAVVAAAWVVLTLALRHADTSPRRLAFGALLGGAAALLASLAAIFVPILSLTSRSPDQQLLPLAIAAIDVVALLLGVLVARLLDVRLSTRAWAILAIVAIASMAILGLVPGVGYLLNLVLLPLLTTLPVALGQARQGSTVALAALWLAVLVAAIVGIQLGGYLVSTIG